MALEDDALDEREVLAEADDDEVVDRDLGRLLEDGLGERLGRRVRLLVLDLVLPGRRGPHRRAERQRVEEVAPLGLGAPRLEARVDPVEQGLPVALGRGALSSPSGSLFRA